MFGGNFHIYYRWMPQQDQLLILHQLHWGYSQQSLRQKAAEHRGRVKVWHNLPAKQSDHRVNLVYNGLSSCQHHPSITRSCSSNPDLRSSHAVLCSKKDNALQALWSLLPTRHLQSEPKWHEIPSTTPDGRKAVFGQQISPISQRRFSEHHWKSGAALTQSPTRLTDSVFTLKFPPGLSRTHYFSASQISVKFYHTLISEAKNNFTGEEFNVFIA